MRACTKRLLPWLHVLTICFGARRRLCAAKGPNSPDFPTRTGHHNSISCAVQAQPIARTGPADARNHRRRRPASLHPQQAQLRAQNERTTASMGGQVTLKCQTGSTAKAACGTMQESTIHLCGGPGEHKHMSTVIVWGQIYSQGACSPYSLSRRDPYPKITPRKASGTGSFQETKMLFPHTAQGG